MAGIHNVFHSTGFATVRNVALAVAVVLWLALAFRVHRDARRRIRDSFLVSVATLLGLVPFIGPLVYLLFRPPETLDDARSRHTEQLALEQQLARTQPACPVCNSPVESDYLACPVCTTKLREPCPTCRAPLEPLWQICPYCVAADEPAQDDLDTALTAETQTLTGTTFASVRTTP